MNSSLFVLHSLLNHRSVLSVNGSSEGDNHFLYSCIDGCECILQFWNHATCYGSVCFVSLKIGMGNHRNYAIVIVWIAEHAFLFKTVYQCALAVSLAMVSALVLRILPLPSWVSGAITGVISSSSNVWSILPLARSTSPTKPKSIPSFNGRL